jgi:hypothetical protein
MRVVLGRLPDRPLRLAQRPWARLRRLGEWAPQRGHQERVRLFREREGRRLAGAADDAAGLAREAAEVVDLAAGGAGGELRREAARDQQLEAEGELRGGRTVARLAVEQPQLVGEQVEDRRARVARLEQSRESARSRSGPCASSVSALVTVRRSLRPSYRSTRRWKNGSSRAPKRLRVRRAPFAIAPTRPCSGV